LYTGTTHSGCQIPKMTQIDDSRPNHTDPIDNGDTAGSLIVTTRTERHNSNNQTIMSSITFLVRKSRARAVRCLSTQAAVAVKPAVVKPPQPPKKTTPLILPVKHSRNQLPPVCIDPVQRAEWTEEILQARIGSLFTFNQEDNTNDTLQAAWVQADASVQKVEFLLRGHAHGIQGTQWNRWVTTTSSMQEVDPDETLVTLQALLDRLWEEGHVYMTLRAARLEELHGPKEMQVLEHSSENDDDDSEDAQIALGEAEDDPGVQAVIKDMEEFAESINEDLYAKDEEDGEEEESYMDDFALPGPTVAMYDTVLDALACQAGTSALATPSAALSIFQDIEFRHLLDGNDDSNTNIHTRPTVLSFNAPIRLAASLTFDPKDIRRRDEALQLAFGCFDALSQSSLLERNSATYCYLLQVVAKYMPESRIRGNIAHGIVEHAISQGLVDQSVLDAHAAANEPSNGKEFEDWKQRNLEGKEKKDLPTAWIRNSRGRRYHSREATY
jgi:hypothetical protein